MFDRIARRYDLVNTVLSAGTDGGWRRRAAIAASLESGSAAIDVACGSGKLTAELARRAGPEGRVVGLDFSAQMLEVARARHPHLTFVEGDALALPFPDGAFDAATIAFGLRNLADPLRGLEEMARVVRRGGRTVVLEFLRPPQSLAGAAYRAYLRTVLPRVGGALSGDPSAYRYLSDTVDAYRTPAELLQLATRAGWIEPRLDQLSAGTVGILTGRGNQGSRAC